MIDNTFFKPSFSAAFFVALSSFVNTASAVTVTEFDWFVGGQINHPTLDQVNNPSPVVQVDVDGQKVLSLAGSGDGNLNNVPQSGTAKVNADVETGTLKAFTQMQGNNGTAWAYGTLGDTITVGGPGEVPTQFGLDLTGIISSQGSFPIGGQVIQLLAAVALPGVILPPEVTGNFSDLTRPFNGSPETVPGLIVNDLENVLFLGESFSVDGPISGDILAEFSLAPGTYQVAYGLNVIGITRDNTSQWTADLFSTAQATFNVPQGYTANSTGGATYIGTFDPVSVPAPPTTVLLALGLAAGLRANKKVRAI